ncbi:MAG: 16S rRNA (cytidine(1402)-2'-O)-methyltransferase [Pseudomonadota bacterium]
MTREPAEDGTPGAKAAGAKAAGAGAARPRPEPGLYLVATPIGNARDITLRALDVLAGCDAIAAEDTRETRKLLSLHGIALGDRPLIAYHDRNAASARPRIAALLETGKSVAYCSDAGTPLVADPGYRLVAMAAEEGFALTALPGASAALAGLTLSGLPTDRFLFAGFLPAKAAARQRSLAELAAVPATLVFFESPHRVVASVADMAAVLGAARPAALARELTKRFETVRRMPLGALAAALTEEGAPKGEIVLVVAPPGPPAPVDPEEAAERLDAALEEALATLSVKDAARSVAETLGLPRREVYARALRMVKGLGEH